LQKKADMLESRGFVKVIKRSVINLTKIIMDDLNDLDGTLGDADLDDNEVVPGDETEKDSDDESEEGSEEEI